jgi:hypothetical protein
MAVPRYGRLLIAAAVGSVAVGLSCVIGVSGAAAAWGTPEVVAAVKRMPQLVGESGISDASNEAVARSYVEASGAGREAGTAAIVTRENGKAWSGKAWSVPVVLSSPRYSAPSPSVTLAPDGETTVAWVQQQVHQGRAHIEVMVKTRSPAGVWERSRILAERVERAGRAPIAEAEPDVTLDVSGRPVVAFCLAATESDEVVEVDRRAASGR